MISEEQLICISPRQSAPTGYFVINTTSRSQGIGQQLSPFLLGPAPLYPGAPSTHALKMENAWQFSKVYPQHLDANGEPTPAYYQWAKTGFQLSRAERYPMGKGIKPAFSLWNGEKLDYISARIKIYIPLYSQLAKKTQAFKLIQQKLNAGHKIALVDFDAFNPKDYGLALTDVPHCKKRTMGHAMVLALMLLHPNNPFTN